jgi:hypothetical protein
MFEKGVRGSGLNSLDTYIKSEELLTIRATVIFWRRTLVFGARWNLCAFDQSQYRNKNTLRMCVGLYHSDNGIWTKERDVQVDGEQLVRNEGIDKM